MGLWLSLMVYQGPNGLPMTFVIQVEGLRACCVRRRVGGARHRGHGGAASWSWRRSLMEVAFKWPCILFTLGALTVTCLLPGSLLTEATPTGRTDVIEIAGPLLGGSNCATVICDRGTPSAPALVPTVALAAAPLMGALLSLVAVALRRRRSPHCVLPRGTPTPLLRPPQLQFR